MEIEKFNENIKSFIETSKAYSKKNVQIKGIEQDQKMKNCLNEICGYQKDTSYLQVEVSMEIPKEILKEYV
ncbi:hypothetical protein LL037_16420 [Clostridium estertheticum]|uniref:Uncharacterized protein n=1 Tax=Clostridium estertheticum TaxID=238834 RepID=A0AA47EKY7_9CLOT|nr:hypothetical protein [Clostridium estertheticum]MBU3157568.1 hypothetical protein [Clostridium estertheticum]MBU3200845.1 hypothetical protein [Clostridium estertheticum]WAG61826.1 hypothetical protein LL038_06160 [Clostridium estertheticum]WAG64053.1 hypothetical protein LL037_16420 [Clostridium estertheticum]